MRVRMVFGFVSLDGREKSSFLINLGSAFALRDKRTILVDHGYPSPALDILCDKAEGVVYTVADVALGRVPLTDALLPLTVGEGRKKRENTLFLLPALPGDEICAMASVLASVRDAADIVLLDMSSDDASTAEGIDGLFYVAAADEISLRAARVFCAEKAFDAFFLMEHPTDAQAIEPLAPLSSLMDDMGFPLLGILPSMPYGLSGAVTGKGRAASYFTAVKNIADRLLGSYVPLLQGVALEGMTREGYMQSDK